MLLGVWKGLGQSVETRAPKWHLTVWPKLVKLKTNNNPAPLKCPSYNHGAADQTGVGVFFGTLVKSHLDALELVFWTSPFWRVTMQVRSKTMNFLNTPAFLNNLQQPILYLRPYLYDTFPSKGAPFCP